MLLYGTPGTGKTHLAVGMLCALMVRVASGKFISTLPFSRSVCPKELASLIALTQRQRRRGDAGVLGVCFLVDFWLTTLV